jgi:formylglycine-generating enzyme required for sulfatase activity
VLLWAKENRAMTKSIGIAMIVIGVAWWVLAAGPAEPSTQPATQPSTQPAKTLTLDLGNKVTLKLVLIPAGKFLMGSPETEKDHAKDEVQHEVTITKPFYLGVYEVTQEQYEAVIGENRSEFKGPRNPVERVSWDDAIQFCNKLSAKTLKTVRLATEAQWESACRAGSGTRFSFGDKDADLYLYGNYADRCCTSPASRNDQEHSDGYDGTAPVGSYKPNAWGLYDMHGNLWEWCADWFADSYANADKTDPTGPASGTERVLRGGCWNAIPMACCSGGRTGYDPARRLKTFGFRVVVVVGTPPEPKPPPGGAPGKDGK